MTTQCDNCGQPLLAGDTECWQCGRRIAGNTSGEAALTPVKQKWEETSPSSELSALTIYGGLTLLLIFLALLVTIYLGRQPLVQAASQLPPDGWSFVTNMRRDFVLMLPESWAVVDVDDSDADAISRLVAAMPELTLAMNPLGGMAEDLQILFIAAGEINGQAAGAVSPPEQFVVVAKSNLLNRLSNEQALAAVEAAAAAGAVDLIEAEYVENFAKSHLFLHVQVPTKSGELSCQQQLIAGASSSLIVAGCGPDQRIPSEILASFQRLAE